MAYDLDAIIRRQIYMQRYGAGYASKVVELTKSGDKELVNLIRDFFDDASQKDLVALMKSNKNNDLVKDLLAEIISIISNQNISIIALANSEMPELAASEIAYTYKALGSSAVTKPSVKEILKLPIVGTSGIEEPWRNIGNNHAKNVLNLITNAAQDNLDAIALIKGTKEQNYKDGALNKRNNALVAQANTQAVGVSSNARTESYKKFEFKKLLCSATLDFRTTPVCRARDGVIYSKDEAPQPPYHYNCRTVLLPWVGEYTERPYVEDKRSVKNIPIKERRGVEGKRDKIGITTDNYAEFFARQSAKDQKEILGAKRYEFYKSGEYTLKDFVDERTGKQYTLAELNRL